MSVIPSLFDQKCLIALKPIPAPWRVPKAAQAWQTDCVDAREIVNRYLKNGWLLMTHPGHYRLTQSGVMAANAMMELLDNTELEVSSIRKISAKEASTLRYKILELLASEEPLNTLQLSQKLRCNQETVRRYLVQLRDLKWVRPKSVENRFRNWYLTAAGYEAVRGLLEL